MISITADISIDEDEIQLNFVRASGPGGQHVNKAATAVQLRFNVKESSSLPGPVRQRMAKLAGQRITGAGELVLDARRFRTQEQNRKDALDRLVRLIRLAAREPKVRRKTKPPAASKRNRLEAKRRRAETKYHRRPVSVSE
jgi:ribosome-associated protein